MMTQAHQAHPEVSVRQLCPLFGASRSWYYACPSAEERAARDVALRDAIEALLLEFPGYGYRRVSHALARGGWRVNHKRVLRVMREESLLCQLKRRFVPTATTDSRHGFPTYPNLLAEAVLTAPDQAWVADITDIRLPTTFVYLACWMPAPAAAWAGTSRATSTRT
jgi:putative transposase